MNIQTLLLTTLALVGCDAEKEPVRVLDSGNCGGEYPFDDEREIPAYDLRRQLNLMLVASLKI